MYQAQRQDKRQRQGVDASGLAWRDDAKCRTMDPRQFELAELRLTPGRRSELAAALCRGCPVVVACALDAIDYGDQAVVRAGVPLGAHVNGVTRKREVIANNRAALADVVARHG